MRGNSIRFRMLEVYSDFLTGRITLEEFRDSNVKDEVRPITIPIKAFLSRRFHKSRAKLEE